MAESKKIYLHLYIARSGVTSRRKAEDLIRSGRVEVNNKKVLIPEFKVHPKDIVIVDGKRIDVKNIFEKDFVYYILNKPTGYICTVKDTHSRKTVLDLIKEKKRIYPVGRLDKDTEGLLILTNDGDLTYRLTHPKFEIDKVYEALITPCIRKKDIKKLKVGVYLDKDTKVQAKIRLLKELRDKSQTKLEVIIHQGIKRQIRRMFSALGYKVVFLKRRRIGLLELGTLKKGKARQLTNQEVKSLKKLVGANYD